jgi:hypothetical protein
LLAISWLLAFVSEPFEGDNIARAVTDPAAFQRIIRTFRDSAEKIRVKKDLPL